MATTHEKIAAEMAHHFIHGDHEARMRIARDCEEQGILSALIMTKLERINMGAYLVKLMKKGLKERGFW